MNLPSLIRQLEKKLNLNISLEPRHAAFSDDPELFLSPDEYWHHCDICRAKKMNSKTFEICRKNKMASIRIAELGRMFAGSCPHGIYELACPVIFDGRLAAVVYFGMSQPGKKIADLGEVRRRAGWLRDYILLELENWAERSQKRKKRSDDYYLEQCRIFLDRCYNQNPALSELAEQLRLNPNYLGEIIRKRSGKTFRRLLFERRMKEAEIFLKLHAQQLTIGEIAHLCGFADSNYFSSCFRRQYGITPGEFSRGKVVSGISRTFKTQPTP